MHRFLYNLLLCITVVAAVFSISMLMKPNMPDISVVDPQEEQSLIIQDSEIEVPQLPKDTTEKQDTVSVDADEEKSAQSEVEVPETAVVAEEKKVVRKITPSAEKTEVVSTPSAEKVQPPPESDEKKSASLPVQEKKTVENEKKSTAVTVAKKKKKQTQKKRKTLVEKSKKPIPTAVWIENFEPDGYFKGVKVADGWKREGGVLFTPKTNFFLRHDEKAAGKSVLVIESKRSSAVFAYDLSGKIDLNKTPILRWRWKVKKLPPNADGRHRKKDDQAVGIYVGSGTAFNQKAVAYRWETETPIGHCGQIVYSNVMKVRFFCQRNKDSGTDVWHEESRNVRDDFLAQFGFVPKNIALAICGNSQNSKSDALAEIDYIGFYEK